MVEKACVKCRYVTDENTCPICGGNKFSSKWSGLLVIFEPDSELAKELNLKVGKYALKVK